MKQFAVSRTIGILFIAFAAGCAGVMEAPPGQSGRLQVDPSLVGSDRGAAVATPPPESGAKAEAAVATPPPESGAKAEAAVATPPPGSGAKTEAAAPPPPPAAAPAKTSASAVATKNEIPPPAAKKPEPTLDVAALKARLRETNAIGVFTKLALKNQVDDLLDQFRAHYQSGQKTSVASLREPYNMLVLKVLSLVQDSDPSLARLIAGSREAIWTILADPEKFNSVT